MEDTESAPNPPKERETRENYSRRLETASAPGKVAGGSRRLSQSQADSDRDKGSGDDMTAAVEGEREEVTHGKLYLQ